MKRVKIESRKPFSLSEKEEILKKSDCKCCHCGKGIDIGSGFTVEHVIPISKGGSNNLSNLVALCNECNEKKTNDVVYPEDYYKYLREEWLKELMANQYLYTETVDWFSLNNFLKVDKEILTLEMDLQGNKRRVSGSRTRLMQVYIKYTLSKAVYSDLDEIYNFIKKYNKLYNIKDDFKGTLAYLFEKGAIYVLRNASKEIISVIPVSLRVDENGEAELVSVVIDGIYFTTNKKDNIDMIRAAWYTIMKDIDSLYNQECLSFFVLYSLKEDSRSREIVESYYGGKNWIAELEEANEKLSSYGYFVAEDSIYKHKSNVNVGLAIQQTSKKLLEKVGMSYKCCERVLSIENYCKLRGYTC